MKPLEARQLEARSRARINHVRVRELVPQRHYVTHSQSQPNQLYHLLLSRSGWRCDCPGFTYSGCCKHIAAVERRSEREGWHFGKVAPR